MQTWPTEREYESTDQLRGSASAATVDDPEDIPAGQLHGDPSILGGSDAELTPSAPER